MAGMPKLTITLTYTKELLPLTHLAVNLKVAELNGQA